MAKFNFCAGWNMPGYLPDGEPVDCETWEDARDSLLWHLERLDCDEAANANADATADELRNATPGTEITTRPVDGYVYWITRAETPFEEGAL